MPTTTYLPPGFLHLPTGLVNICGSVHKDRDRKKWGKTNDSRSSLMCNGICHGIGEKVFQGSKVLALPIRMPAPRHTTTAILLPYS